MSLIRKAFKRLHYPVDIIAQCVRWYLAYSLSLRNLEEMMAERGIIVDHATLHRWVIRIVPLLDKVFRRYKRQPGRRWRMDETYINVRVMWSNNQDTKLTSITEVFSEPETKIYP